MDLEDYFGQKWSLTMSGLHINRNCMMVDLLETNSRIDIFATRVQCVVTYIAWFGKT